MTDGVVLAAISGLLWALNTIAVRWVMQGRRLDPYVGAMVNVAGTAATMSVVALVVSHSWVALSDLWVPVLLGVILPGIGQGIFFKAISDLGASRTGVIVGSAPILSALLAIAFLDEAWTVPLAVGTVLTVVGGGLIAAGERSSSRIRVIGLVMAALTAVAFATRDVMARQIVGDIDVAPFVAVAITQFAGLVVLLGTNTVRLGRDLPGAVRASLPVMLLPVAIQCAALGAIFSAFDRADVTVVAPMNNATQTIGVVVLGALVLGRAEAALRIVIAVVLVTTGAVLVGVSA